MSLHAGHYNQETARSCYPADPPINPVSTTESAIGGLFSHLFSPLAAKYLSIIILVAGKRKKSDYRTRVTAGDIHNYFQLGTYI